MEEEFSHVPGPTTPAACAGAAGTSTAPITASAVTAPVPAKRFARTGLDGRAGVGRMRGASEDEPPPRLLVHTSLRCRLDVAGADEA
ncbi:hypothetical protein GCM10022197_43100 [Microlunatus spumicola]|uniref:Uncharacterized protein n=1 Tax=Microlunatus spumicola TaxID=81499 RepID=A0ABP6YBM9_9ACTN